MHKTESKLGEKITTMCPFWRCGNYL